jgi:hypothetical protein
MIPPRFSRAVNAARPFGTHRFDVFGPKVARPLTLYGWNALHLWVRLEADPRVLTYCERPLHIPDVRPMRPVDFWVREKAEERLLVVLRSAEAAANAQGSQIFPAFHTWSRTRSMALRTICSSELDDPEWLRRNRLTMLRHVAAGMPVCGDSFAPEVLEACRNSVTLAELEHRFAPLDPAVLRAVAFKLVLNGALQCPTLATHPLGLNSTLVAA